MLKSEFRKLLKTCLLRLTQGEVLKLGEIEVMRTNDTPSAIINYREFRGAFASFYDRLAKGECVQVGELKISKVRTSLPECVQNNDKTRTNSECVQEPKPETRTNCVQNPQQEQAQAVKACTKEIEQVNPMDYLIKGNNHCELCGEEIPNKKLKRIRKLSMWWYVCEPCSLPYILRHDVPPSLKELKEKIKVLV